VCVWVLPMQRYVCICRYGYVQTSMRKGIFVNTHAQMRATSHFCAHSVQHWPSRSFQDSAYLSMPIVFQHAEITDEDIPLSAQIHRLRVSLAETREDVAALISV
jgi:hypothetical protein